MNKKILEKYTDSPYLRALVNLVPNIGGAVDVLLSEKGAKYRKERFENFLVQLEKRIEKLELQENEITERFSNEEFYDLFVHAVESCLKTRHERKHIYYANILQNQLDLSKEDLHNAELMMITLDNLSIDEIEYLSKLYNSHGKLDIQLLFGEKVYFAECIELLQKNGSRINSKNDIPEESKCEYSQDIIWKFLSDKNIVEIEKNDRGKTSQYSFGNSSQMTTEHIQFDSQIIYRISGFGNEFIKWIVDDE